MVSAVAIEDLDEPGGGVDAQLVASSEELCHATREAIDQSDAAKGRALREDRVDAIEDQRLRDNAARRHFMQHPGGGDPALGVVENEDAAGVALAEKLVARAREDPFGAVEIIARAEIVGGGEGR